MPKDLHHSETACGAKKTTSVGFAPYQLFNPTPYQIHKQKEQVPIVDLDRDDDENLSNDESPSSEMIICEGSLETPCVPTTAPVHNALSPASLQSDNKSLSSPTTQLKVPTIKKNVPQPQLVSQIPPIWSPVHLLSTQFTKQYPSARTVGLPNNSARQDLSSTPNKKIILKSTPKSSRKANTTPTSSPNIKGNNLPVASPMKHLGPNLLGDVFSKNSNITASVTTTFSSNQNITNTTGNIENMNASSFNVAYQTPFASTQTNFTLGPVTKKPLDTAAMTPVKQQPVAKLPFGSLSLMN